MPRRKGLPFWSIQVTKAMDEAVEKAVQKGLATSKSDFVRNAVRKALESHGLI